MTEIIKLKTIAVLAGILLLLSCKKELQLTGIYKCSDSDTKSYFHFFSNNRVKYQDQGIYPTLYLFRYEIKGKLITLYSEQAKYTVTIVDDNTIEVDRALLFFKNKLIYKKLR